MKPKTIPELLKDNVFLANLDQIFSDIKHQRKIRLQPQSGFHYKRDWFDRMSEQSQLHSVFLLDNIESILDKKSNLSSEIRSVLFSIYQSALVKTLDYYDELDTNLKTKNYVRKKVKKD